MTKRHLDVGSSDNSAAMGAPSCMYLTAPMSATVCSVPLSRIYSLKIALTKPWSSHELRTALEQRVRESANRLGYRYLQSDVEERCLTYGQLATNAHELAAVIRKHISPGQRVVLLYPAGLQFIQAFFACLLANVVAVPLPIPKPNDTAHRLDHVLKDCEPAAIFTETGFRAYKRTTTGCIPRCHCGHRRQLRLRPNRSVPNCLRTRCRGFAIHLREHVQTERCGAVQRQYLCQLAAN